ncbi:hypothetical protein HF086_003616 [Spodoptera exigua]|uniref:Uncharacterized protein n=1 Tax=Spodoptera exigua TaxID=7107 RepID=A0A922SJK0_SPOEX|nr:hypothetical protein HF086_003616 [Spodoptera exigua]
MMNTLYVLSTEVETPKSSSQSLLSVQPGQSVIVSQSNTNAAPKPNTGEAGADGSGSGAGAGGAGAAGPRGEATHSSEDPSSPKHADLPSPNQKKSLFKKRNEDEEEGTVVTPQLEAEVMNGNGMPTPHSYGTPHTTTNKLVGNTFFGPDFNLDTYRGYTHGYFPNKNGSATEDSRSETETDGSVKSHSSFGSQYPN